MYTYIFVGYFTYFVLGEDTDHENLGDHKPSKMPDIADQYGSDDAYQFGVVGGQITGGPNRPKTGAALYTMLNCILRLLPII